MVGLDVGEGTPRAPAFTVPMASLVPNAVAEGSADHTARSEEQLRQNSRSGRRGGDLGLGLPQPLDRGPAKRNQGREQCHGQS